MLLTNGELITMFNFFKKKNKSTKTSITNIVINANCVIESGKHNYYDNIPRLNLEIVEKYTDGTKNLFKKKIPAYATSNQCFDPKFANKKYLDTCSNDNCTTKTYYFSDLNIDITCLDDKEIDEYFSKYLQSL
jgi:hypothetical protein